MSGQFWNAGRLETGKRRVVGSGPEQASTSHAREPARGGGRVCQQANFVSAERLSKASQTPPLTTHGLSRNCFPAFLKASGKLTRVATRRFLAVPLSGGQITPA